MIDVDNSVTDVVKYPFLNIGGVMANQYKDSRLASFTVGSVSGVYMITDTVTNRTYIGSSTNIRNRLGQHLGKIHNEDNTTTYANFISTYKKHGVSSFNIKILIICAKENLKFYEASCIGALNPTENTMKRNDGRIAFTDEERKKKAERTKALWADPSYREKSINARKGNAYNKGYKCTPEQIENRKRAGRISNIKRNYGDTWKVEYARRYPEFIGDLDVC